MNTPFKYLAVLSLTFGLAACGGDDDDGPNPTPTPTPTPEPELTTVVDAAVAAGNFTTLVAALQATSLDAVLDDPDGSFTVFAPTDAAFALLGSDTITALLADTDTLSDILLYHVVSGAEVDSTTAVSIAGTTVEMANGDSVGLSLGSDGLLVNMSLVTTADITTDNGIIHVLDAVLMPPADRGEPSANIVETAIAAGSFTTLVAALQAAGLDDDLANEEATFTVFAPTDAAFEAVGEDNIAALLGDADALQAVLLQHVVGDAEINSIGAYAANGTSVTTLSGAEVAVSITDSGLMVGGALVTSADIYTTNGVIHVIDAVIVGDVDLPSPPVSLVDVAVGAGSFTTLVAALQATGLDDTLANLDGTFTVFAPTDAAFAELGEDTIAALLADTDTLSNILLYHVIADAEILADAATTVAASDSSLVDMANGDKAGLSLVDSTLFVNLSTVTAANVMADNGVIHVIDKVMLPPAAMGEPSMNIVETAIANGSFTTLVTALQAAGLDSVLADEDATFTVFAPTDDAFALIPEADLNALIADTDALTAVLLGHVVSGAAVDAVTAFTLNGASATTAGDAELAISIVDGKLMVGASTVVMTDIYTTNGIIHVIDAVILGADSAMMMLPIEDGLAGWSSDAAPTTLTYSAGEMLITPDWSADDQIAVYTAAEAGDYTGAEVTWVLDIPAEYVGAGINLQPYLQQNSGEYQGDFSAWINASDLVEGENTISYTFATPPVDIQRFGLQLKGSDRTASPTVAITVKSVSIDI